MKKTANILALSTILLGAFTPTGQVIAETVPLEKGAPNVVQSEPSTSSSSSNKSKISEGSTSSSSLSTSNNSRPLKKTDSSTVPSTSSTAQSAGAIKNDDIKKSTTISKENEKINKQSYENVNPGDLGKQLFDEGIQNARANNDKSLGDKLTQKDWSEIREAGILFQKGVHVGPDPESLLQLGGGTVGNGIVWAGNVYVGLRDSQTKEFISSINVFSLDESKVPTSSEIAEMGLVESARYNMPSSSDESEIPQEYSNFLVDSNIQIDTSPLASILPEQITPKSTVANAEVKRTDVTAVITGINSRGDLSNYPVGTSFIFDNEITAKVSNGSIRAYSYAETPKKQREYLSVDAIDSLLTLGVKAKTKSTDKLIFFSGREDERINNPSTLVDLDNLVDNSGQTITNSSKVNISWEIAPDTTQKTNDGSAVLKIDASAVNTGSSKYKDGITYLRVPYIVKEIQPILVKYINEEGISIHGDQTITASNEGDPYDASTSTYKLDDIVGTDGVNYHLDTTKLPSNATGVFGEEPVTVTYTYKKNQTAMNVHDSTIYVGDKWSTKSNWDSTLNMDGKSVDFAEVEKNGKIEGKVDTSTPGTYQVTYTYQDATAVATITVKPNLGQMNVHDSTIYVGDDWKAEDNFDSALDKDGNAVEFSKLTVDDSKKDTSKAGAFDVTYSYDGVTSTAKVTVKDKQTAVNVHDSTIYVGDDWKAEDNFDSALDKDGNAVEFSKLTVDDSKKDTSKAGAFDVTYSYDGVTSTAKVTVKDKQTAVNVHDSIIYVGDDWKAEDNFDSALDKDGNAVEFSKLTVDDSKKDTSKAGTFDVTYSYDGVTSTAKVTVKDKQTAVNVHDSTIYVGDDWKAEDNFDSALDKDGNAVEFSKLTVDDSKKDTSKAGAFDVTYSYDGVTSTAKVTVKDKQTAVNVHDSIIYVGDDWKAEDNFDSALDKDGNAVEFSKLTVDDSKKDTSKAGTFDVTYSYDGVTSTAKVTVKDKQTAVNVHDSTIYVGDDWKAEDNFDSALDKDGNAVEFSKLTVDDSKKDTSKAGTFDVTYSYDGVTSTAKITVKGHNSVPVIPDKPKATIPPTHATSSNGKGMKTSPKPKVTSKSLPKTGEKTGWILTGSGFSIVLLLIAYLFTKTRRNNK